MYAIITSYEPKKDQLNNLCNSILKFSDIIIVDNSIINKLTEFDFNSSKITLVRMNGNEGIAKAQNVGAQLAFDKGATDIIFFDQDSDPGEKLIDDLISTRNLAIKAGLNVAAVGPQHYDPRSGVLSNFIKVNKFSIERIFRPEKTDFCVTSFLISSGCLINKYAWYDIGPNEDGLFIDCVDLEWGFRAASKGYQCIGSFKAQMNHCIGDDHLIAFGKRFTYHKPIRHYYFYRNFYSLLKRSYIPFSWKICVFFKSIIQAIVFILFSEEKKSQMKMILLGVWDGLLGIEGKYK